MQKTTNNEWIYTYSSPWDALGWALVLLLVLLAVAFAVCVFMIVTQWKLFKKTGEHGWAALVPFYNSYVMTKITWGNGWLFLLLLLPLGNLIFMIATYIKLAKAFGKSGGFAVGLIFLPIIFIPILAFGSADYEGPDDHLSKGVIIAAVIAGAFYIIIMVFAGITGFNKAVEQMNDETELALDQYYEEDAGTTADIGDDINQGTESSADIQLSENTEYEAMEGTDHFVKVSLEGVHGIVEIPMLNGYYMDVSGDTAMGLGDGITVTARLLSEEDTDCEAKVKDTVDGLVYTYELVPDLYQDLAVDDMITGDGFALQQINYSQSGAADGKTYPCFEIVKCDVTDAGMIMLHLEMDNTQASENTKEIFEEACEVYGIEFQAE